MKRSNRLIRISQIPLIALAASLAGSSGLAAGLDDQQLGSLRQAGSSEGAPAQGDHWTDKFQIGGHAATGAILAGENLNDYRRKNFVVHEMNLFFKATPAKDTSMLVEAYPIAFMPAFFNGLSFYVGEAYVQFKNVLAWGDNNSVSFKLGRFDLPFGTDYMRQDAVDNALITKPIAWLWGFDEGLMINTKLGALGTSLAITDGALSRQLDDSGQKTYTLKAWMDVHPTLMLVASAHLMAPQYSHAMYQGQKVYNNILIPGGAKTNTSFTNEYGTYTCSASSPCSAGMSQGQVYEFSGTFKKEGFTTHFNAGRMFFETSNAIKRQPVYYSVQPMYAINSKWYAAGMYSAYGTFSDSEGMTISDSLGNNIEQASSITRLTVGAGYKLNLATTLKAEFMQDRLTMIEGQTSPGDERTAFGFQAAMKF